MHKNNVLTSIDVELEQESRYRVSSAGHQLSWRQQLGVPKWNLIPRADTILSFHSTRDKGKAPSSKLLAITTSRKPLIKVFKEVLVSSFFSEKCWKWLPFCNKNDSFLKSVDVIWIIIIIIHLATTQQLDDYVSIVSLRGHESYTCNWISIFNLAFFSSQASFPRPVSNSMYRVWKWITTINIWLLYNIRCPPFDLKASK